MSGLKSFCHICHCCLPRRGGGAQLRELPEITDPGSNRGLESTVPSIRTPFGLSAQSTPGRSPSPTLDNLI